MNNNEACAAYFKENPVYQRCFSEFEKKWNSYGRVTGIITLKNTFEEERRAIGGILGKTFYEDTVRFSFAEFENLLAFTVNGLVISPFPKTFKPLGCILPTTLFT